MLADMRIFRIYAYMHAYMRMLAYMRICVHICVHACIYAYMHAFMRICVHICVHACIYGYARIYAYMRVQGLRATPPAAMCSPPRLAKKVPNHKQLYINSIRFLEAVGNLALVGSQPAVVSPMVAFLI